MYVMIMKRYVLSVSTWLVVLLGVFLPKVRAVSITLQDVPSTIDQNQEFEVPLVFECQNCSSDSYIRAAFYTAGNSNYFGFTQVSDGSWINAPGGSCTKYPVISAATLHEGTWSGKLKVKPDTGSAYYNGPGEYLFKVGRYTGSCSSPTWSGEKTIAITGPTHTPTPAPTPSNTPTPFVPTSTPISIPSNTPTAIITPTTIVMTLSHMSISPSHSIEVQSSNAAILGISESNDDIASLPIGTESAVLQTKPIIISLLLIATGFGLLSGLFAWKKHIEISRM